MFLYDIKRITEKNRKPFHHGSNLLTTNCATQLLIHLFYVSFINSNYSLVSRPVANHVSVLLDVD